MKFSKKLKTIIEEASGKKELKSQLEKQNSRINHLMQQLEEVKFMNQQLAVNMEELMFFIAETFAPKPTEFLSEQKVLAKSEENSVQIKEPYDVN